MLYPTTDVIDTYVFRALMDLGDMSMAAAVGVFCLVPFITVIGSSFSTETSILKYGYNVFSREFTLDAYKLIFKDDTIYKAYGVTPTTCSFLNTSE